MGNTCCTPRRKGAKRFIIHRLRRLAPVKYDNSFHWAGADYLFDRRDRTKTVIDARQISSLTHFSFWPFYLALALSANCQVFLDSCLRRQFTLLKNTLNMETYVLLGCL
jgi:hypothetical protein